ncbi:hypothetical protein PMAYCL1PPCAC_05746, partial [Pristionchus mayeri]
LSTRMNSAGKSVFTVMRSNDSVTLHQTRFLSINFNEKHRDSKTRYTLPIFYRINGTQFVKVFRKNETSLTIPVEKYSTFIIDNRYDRLYHIFYKDAPHNTNVSQELRWELQYIYRKSLLAALEQGAIKYVDFAMQAMYYVKQHGFSRLD